MVIVRRIPNVLRNQGFPRQEIFISPRQDFYLVAEKNILTRALGSRASGKNILTRPSSAGPRKEYLDAAAGQAGRPGWAGLGWGKGQNAVLEASGRPPGRRLPKEIS